MIRTAALLALMPFAATAQTADQKAALIAAMNASDCTLTTAEASQVLPRLGITRPAAIALSRQMMTEGIATFASDEETLVLLPPACTK
ncbi:hypothetical protein [Pseudaestuariivita sp.]|uniref:hypothetical protein n=1 Tax=Pseudaestuariivita sp. TaxID=2211669 RepID=UPI0040599AEC